MEKPTWKNSPCRPFFPMYNRSSVYINSLTITNNTFFEHPFFCMARSTEQDLRDEMFIHCFTIRSVTPFFYSGNRYRVEPEH